MATNKSTTAATSVSAGSSRRSTAPFDHRLVEPAHRGDNGTAAMPQLGMALALQTRGDDEPRHRPVRGVRAVRRRDERRQLFQQSVLAIGLRNAVSDHRIRFAQKAVVDLFPGVEVVVHRRPAQIGPLGDGLKIRRLIAAFGDHLSRGAKNARACLGRVGTNRAARSPTGRQEPGATSPRANVMALLGWVNRTRHANDCNRYSATPGSEVSSMARRYASAAPAACPASANRCARVVHAG